MRPRGLALNQSTAVNLPLPSRLPNSNDCSRPARAFAQTSMLADLIHRYVPALPSLSEALSVASLALPASGRVLLDPRLDGAAPAAFCCALDFAGI